MQGCELVIALTHMRWPNDTRLAREAPEIDLVLGGHDHDFHYEQARHIHSHDALLVPTVVALKFELRHWGHLFTPIKSYLRTLLLYHTIVFLFFE